MYKSSQLYFDIIEDDKLIYSNTCLNCSKKCKVKVISDTVEVLCKNFKLISKS